MEDGNAGHEGEVEAIAKGDLEVAVEAVGRAAPSLSIPQIAMETNMGELAIHFPPTLQSSTLNTQSILEARYTPYAQQYHSQLRDSASQHSDHRYASPPVVMGPPIRLGFTEQQGVDTQSFPQNQYDHFNHHLSQRSHDPRPQHRQDSSYGPQPPRHRSPTRQRGGRGSHNKRGTRGHAVGSTDSNRRTEVAPAVPSFGNPLPVKPPASLPDTKKQKKKKKRRVNQLGLTPKAEEHVSSSEEEEDIDEELKFASTAQAGAQLEITYKGSTSVLQSSSDIAAWLEERKKKFPTAARKAENQARLQKLKDEREAKWREQKAQKALERQQKALEHAERAKQEAAAKSKSKVEKLRQKLLKEERRIAKAEAKSLKRSAPADLDGDDRPETKRVKSEGDEMEESSVNHQPSNEPATLDGHRKTTSEIQAGDPGSPSGINQTLPENQATLEKLQEAEPPSSIPDPLTPTSQPLAPEKEGKPDSEANVEVSVTELNSNSPSKPTAEHNHNVRETDNTQVTLAIDAQSSTTLSGTSISSSDLSEDDDDDSDDTSSSGSSSSSSDSDDEAPKTASSRRKGPEKVAPPKRNGKQERPICRYFLQSGRCKWGKKCKWRHALPERGHKKGAEEEMPSRSVRKSLHQRLVEQELEKEREEKKKKLEQQQKDETSHGGPAAVGPAEA
ncbi:MAG: hypothetical protein Q9222_005146 [Ikaeria aurantiellina]